MDDATRELWGTLAQRFTREIGAPAKATLARLWERQSALVKLFDEAGVKMLAGSDFGGHWVIAGFGLHREFDLLATAGLSPLTVLQMTTRNGAEFLGRETTMGSVDVGKDANLVILAANPVASVQSLHGIHAVVRAGAYYSKEALAELRAQVEQTR